MASVSTILFETPHVVLYKIPPGSPCATHWQLDPSSEVWRGSLRMYEEEIIRTDSTEPECTVPIATPLPPHQGLRAKLDFFNTKRIASASGNPISKDFSWAETWYNPSCSDWKVANNGDETIQITKDSSRTYRVIVQHPQSGYHVSTPGQDTPAPTQVALGMRLEDAYAASEFSAALGLYRRRFGNFQEQYELDKKLQSTSISDYGSESRYTYNRHDESDDDSFDDFVSAERG